MEVSLAVFADYANVSQEGKLNILGIYNKIFVQSFPGALLQGFLVLRLVADVEEKGTRHRLRVRMTDPDGKWLTEISADLEVPDDGTPGAPEIDLILQSGPLTRFERPGPHELQVFLDDVEQRTIKIAVTQFGAPVG